MNGTDITTEIKDSINTSLIGAWQILSPPIWSSQKSPNIPARAPKGSPREPDKAHNFLEVPNVEVPNSTVIFFRRPE